MTYYDVVDSDGYTEKHWHFKTKNDALNYAKMLSSDGNTYGIIRHNEKSMSKVEWIN